MIWCRKQQVTDPLVVSNPCSETRGKARSKRRPRSSSRQQHTRGRLYTRVMKRAYRLVAAGDLLIFLHPVQGLPFGLKGKLGSLFQGVTKQQARAIVAAPMDELDWGG